MPMQLIDTPKASRPLPVSRMSSGMRRFLLTFDTRKRSVGRVGASATYAATQAQTAEGIQFSSGHVVLDTHIQPFDTLTEMELYLTQIGNYGIEWLDD